MRRLITALVFAAAVSAGETLHAAAAAQGTVYKKDGGQVSGIVKWSVRDKGYAVTQKQANGSTMDLTIPLKEVDRLEIKQPQGMDQLIAQVETGKGSSAIAGLQKIADDYAHLQWDLVAGSYLARAYIDSNNGAKALDICQKIIDVDPSAGYRGDLAPTYWQALIKNNKGATLEKMLAKAATSGDRFSSGSALIARGDACRAKEDTPAAARQALVDGYLRVVLLYTDAEVAARLRPEALYKAAQCFERIGQTARASDLRTELKGRYASSPWAAR